MRESIFCLSIFALLGVSCGPSSEELQNERIQSEYQDSLKQARKFEDDRLEELRMDSLNFYFHLSDSLIAKLKWKNAGLYLDSALLFSTYSGEDSLNEKRAAMHFKDHQYELAIEDFTVLLDKQFNLSNNLYQRALCYQKRNEIPEAVEDLKQAISLGNKDAEVLHEKLNPERKRVAYYVTRCWDGSTSNSSGRGACSHHGGVKNWNEPVYETYRKY